MASRRNSRGLVQILQSDRNTVQETAVVASGYFRLGGGGGGARLFRHPTSKAVEAAIAPRDAIEPAFNQFEGRQLLALDQPCRLGDGQEVRSHGSILRETHNMRWFRRHIAAAGSAQPCHHVLDHDGGRGNPVAFLFRHVEPEPGYCRIEFLSGHVRPPYCIAGRGAAADWYPNSSRKTWSSAVTKLVSTRLVEIRR